jgi:hypothetical protein
MKLAAHPLTLTELALCTATASVMGGISGYAFATGTPAAGWVFAFLAAVPASMWLLRAAHEITYWRSRRAVIAAAEEMTAHGKR